MYLMPGATQRPIRYRGEAPLFAHTPLGWVLHVQAGNGSPWAWFNNLTKPDRAFSHLWVSKSGHVEQYQTLDRQSWAQGDGNDDYWSVETEGHPNERLNSAQLLALARIHVQLKTKDILANTPNSLGIGTHGMGGAAWGGHPLCPGALRAGQRASIIVEAVLIRHHNAPPPYPGLLRRGSTGPNVIRAQGRLNVKGYHLVVDGSFGPVTERQVKHFQFDHRLDVDGVIGPLTWARLWQ